MIGHPYFTWTSIGEAPPPAAPAERVRYPGGHPLLRLPKRKKRELTQEVIEVIHRIAESQVERLETDKHKQFEELERELQAREIEWNSRYLTALSQRREFLIEQEIGRLLKKKIQTDEEEAVIALLMAVL